MSDGATGALDRASALVELGRFQQAAEHLARVLAVEPGNPAALTLLARARLGLDDHEGALAAAEAAVAAEPDNEWALRLASLASGEIGRQAESVRLARRAVAVAPDVSVTHARLAFALTGSKSDLAEATEAADTAVRLDPHSVDAHLAVGHVAATAGRHTDARAAYERVLAIDPTSAAAHNNLARLHVRTRRPGNSAGLAAAAGGFASALQADPNYRLSRRNLDIVLHTFLARLTYYVFLIAYLGSRIDSGTHVARAALWLPFAALVLPALFAANFVRHLSVTLRRFLVQVLRRPSVAAPVSALALACVLLLVGALAPAVATGAFVASVLLSVAARFGLYLERRRQGLTAPRAKRWWRRG